MIKYYMTSDGVTEEIREPQDNCWVCMTNPTRDEIRFVAEKYEIEDEDDLTAALDEEESSRVDVEDNYTLVLVDVPTLEERNEKSRYCTIPMGILLTKKAIITVCLEENASLLFYRNKLISSTFSTAMRTRFLLQFLYFNAQLYLKYLRMINKESEDIEKRLHVSTENPALIDMMELGKGLLYFTTSLKSLNKVIEKVQRTSSIKKYEDDEELLDDVIVENRQALEMSEVYSGLLNGLMDAYASIISNNMNVLQKFLAFATIVLSIPTMVFDAYGMNFAKENMLFAASDYAFPIIIGISLALSFVAYLYFRNKKMY